MSNDNTKKKATPFAKKEITTVNPVEEEQPKPTFFFENKLTGKKQWLGKRTREESFGVASEEEHSGEAEEDSDLEDASMDEADLPDESQESLVDCIQKEFTLLRSTMFVLILLQTSRNSKSAPSLPSISLDSLQAIQTKLEMVQKYLSDTSK